MEHRTFNGSYHNMKQWFKGRIKNFTGGCNWPELSRYCGCCPLSTGIYIRSVVVIIITVITIAINGLIISHLRGIGSMFDNANETSMRVILFERPRRDWDKVYFLYRSLLIYHILNCAFKCIYLMTAIWTIYAIYRKKTILLKILVYISVPNLILDILISIVGTRLLNTNMRILLILCIISEGYNILAINSEYKKMTGKSRLVYKDESNQCDAYRDYNQPYRDHRFQNIQVHCTSCTCFDNIIENPERNYNQEEIRIGLPRSESTGYNVTRRTALYENTNETGGQINEHQQNNNTVRINQSATSNLQIAEEITSVVNTATNSSHRNRADRPNTLDIQSNNVTEIKIDLSNDPVIYDERQLNVGSSPVIEDRPLHG